MAERKFNQTYVSKFIIQNESLITIKMYQIRSNAMTHAIACLTCDPLQLQSNICISTVQGYSTLCNDILKKYLREYFEHNIEREYQTSA